MINSPRLASLQAHLDGSNQFVQRAPATLVKTRQPDLPKAINPAAWRGGGERHPDQLAVNTPFCGSVANRIFTRFLQD